VLQIAHGSTRLMVIANTIAVVLLAPLMDFAATRFGAAGAAAVWVALNAGYIVLLLRYMHRAVLPNELRGWFLVDVGPPLLAAACAAIAWKLATTRADTLTMIVVEVAIASAVSLAAAALVAPHVRSIVATVLSRGARAT
jgi:hypothetical protein